VALVRPGPIQGGMVHPYLKRRQGLEPAHYPKPEIRAALERTLGVPIFQEQVMQVAILAAGFTPGEADQLRRAMAAWKRKGGLETYYQRIVGGMLERGYELEFAEAIFNQIQGFGEYGFPESHAASFALLAYASAWIKRHEPAAFLCALLNSQPMGFYSPSQLVQDARRHGIEVRPVDIAISGWESTLEEAGEDKSNAACGAKWRPASRTRARSGGSTASPTWPAGQGSTAATCRCWPPRTPWLRWPATAARRCGRRSARCPTRTCCARPHQARKRRSCARRRKATRSSATTARRD
jgi:hypothetical protein